MSEVGPVFDLENFKATYVAPIIPDAQAVERGYALLADSKLPPVLSGEQLEDL